MKKCKAIRATVCCVCVCVFFTSADRATKLQRERKKKTARRNFKKTRIFVAIANRSRLGYFGN